MLTNGLLRIENKVDKLSDALNKLAHVEAQQSIFLDAQRRTHERIDRIEQQIGAVDARIDTLNKFRWQAAGVIGVVTFIGTLVGADLVKAVASVWIK